MPLVANISGAQADSHTAQQDCLGCSQCRHRNLRLSWGPHHCEESPSGNLPRSLSTLAWFTLNMEVHKQCSGWTLGAGGGMVAVTKPPTDGLVPGPSSESQASCYQCLPLRQSVGYTQSKDMLLSDSRQTHFLESPPSVSLRLDCFVAGNGCIVFPSH